MCPTNENERDTQRAKRKKREREALNEYAREFESETERNERE